VKKLLLLIVVGLLAYFVWPTRYRTYDPGEGPYAEQTDYSTRVDRFSGDVTYQRRTGEWLPLEPEQSFHPPQPNPVTDPYTRVDQHEVHRQRKQAESTQKMIDQTVDQAQTQQTPAQ